MISIDPGKVTAIQLIEFTASLGPVGYQVTSIRMGLVLNKRVVEINTRFAGLPESPAVKSAMEQLVLALEGEVAVLAGLTQVGEATQSTPVKGLGRNG
jgi:hypothetical protein